MPRGVKQETADVVPIAPEPVPNPQPRMALKSCTVIEPVPIKGAGTRSLTSVLHQGLELDYLPQLGLVRAATPGRPAILIPLQNISHMVQA